MTSIRWEECSLCAGSGVVEQFQERVADKWRPGGPIADGWSRAEWRRFQDRCAEDSPGAFRWHETDCPRCGGAGSYEVEYVACRIF